MAKRVRSRPAKTQAAPRPRTILSIDIGGTSAKILVTGETEARKLPTGTELTPGELVDRVKKLARDWRYSAVSIGYPGLVGANGPLAEPGNLGSGWVGFDFAAAFDCPVRVVNDATMQALGSYDGGRMLFLGLGTGVGSVLIVQHTALPLELGELRVKRDRTLSEHIGRRALEEVGKKKWRARVAAVVPALQRAFLADYVVLGGGNAQLLKDLPPNVRLGHNLTAFRGGYRVWGIDDVRTLDAKADPAKAAETTGDWRLL